MTVEHEKNTSELLIGKTIKLPLVGMLPDYYAKSINYHNCSADKEKSISGFEYKLDYNNLIMAKDINEIINSVDIMTNANGYLINKKYIISVATASRLLDEEFNKDIKENK